MPRPSTRPRICRARNVLLVAGLLTASTAPGCEPPPPETTAEGASGGPPGLAADPAAVADSVTTADSVREIRNPRPAWTGRARLELVREVRGVALPTAGGAEEGRPSFAGIRDLSPAADDRVLVLDGEEARVTVLDGTGRVARQLGSRGPGPGELRTPDRVEPSPGDDGVLVFERRPAAVHRWGPSGDYGGSTRLSAADSAARGITGMADWDGPMPGGRAVRLIGLRAADPSSSSSAVHVADTSGRMGPPVVAWSTPGTRSRLPEVFGARRSWAAGRGPDGSGRIFVARGDRYEIRSYGLDGRLRAAISREVEPAPVGDGLRERALDRFLEEAARAGAPPAMTRERRDRIPVAETLPVIAELWHSGADGRLWVGIPGPGAAGEPPMVIRAYDVYEASGRFLGRVASPPGFRLHRVREGRLYGSWRNSLDVPGVRVYRLVEPS